MNYSSPGGFWNWYCCEAFAALRSLVRAEAQRINHLFYCVRLRCMIMPTRFACLVRLESTTSAAEPPGPNRMLRSLHMLLKVKEGHL